MYSLEWWGMILQPMGWPMWSLLWKSIEQYTIAILDTCCRMYEERVAMSSSAPAMGADGMAWGGGALGKC